MAKPPETAPEPRRKPRPPRARSHGGRILGAALAIGTTLGVGTGLHQAGNPAAPTRVCGGTERWNVKVANDADAPKIEPNPTGPYSVAALNAVLPGPVDAGGRMDVEKKEYTVRGFLSYFKSEDDGDYHVVIADKPGDFTRGKVAPNGRSMVVEFPDPACFKGKSGLGGATSALGQTLAEARAAFEGGTSALNGAKISKPVAVTVTGVGFFDFDHGQTGRSTPHPGADGQSKVFELHPVTAISFDDGSEPD